MSETTKQQQEHEGETENGRKQGLVPSRDASLCSATDDGRSCIYDASHGGDHLSVSGFGEEHRWNDQPQVQVPSRDATGFAPEFAAMDKEFAEREASAWGWDDCTAHDVLLYARAYRAGLHAVETRCDPAGEVQRMASLEEQVRGLTARLDAANALAEGVRHAMRENAILGVHHTRLPALGAAFDAMESADA